MAAKPKKDAEVDLDTKVRTFTPRTDAWAVLLVDGKVCSDRRPVVAWAEVDGASIVNVYLDRIVQFPVECDGAPEIAIYKDGIEYFRWRRGLPEKVYDGDTVFVHNSLDPSETMYSVSSWPRLLASCATSAAPVILVGLVMDVSVEKAAVLAFLFFVLAPIADYVWGIRR